MCCRACLTSPTSHDAPGECPLAFPSWNITADGCSQGLWRRYSQRFPYLDFKEPRPGYSGAVKANELATSVLMAPFAKFVRYFGDERYHADEESSDEESFCPARKAIFSKKQSTIPSTVNRYIWDDVHDDTTHAHFDEVFTQLLPGNKIVFGAPDVKTNAWRRLHNGRLQFPRFLQYDLSLKETPFHVSNRTMHFQMRLFCSLPWLHLPVPASWRCTTLVSPLPLPSLLDVCYIEGSALCGESARTPDYCGVPP